MAWFILGVCLLAALLLAGNWFVNADPKILARALRYVGVGVLGAAAVFFLFTGRFMFGIPLAMAAYAVLRGVRMPSFNIPGGLGQHPSSGQTSDVETDYLRMSLEHDTGVMKGEVLKGPYTGKSLSELDLPQLLSLLSDCHREDPHAAQLLETYLDRAVGSDWREAAQAAGGEEEAPGEGGSRRRGPKPNGAMSREEAYEILGLAKGASAEEVREAYRRLMQKLHPDQGGSTYLAAKINQAKDLLLGL